MLGSAFSMVIRMELAAPGAQYLQGDNQLYNGASSNLIDRRAILFSSNQNKGESI